MATREELKQILARKLEANPGMKLAMLAESLGVSEAELLAVWPRSGEIVPLITQDVVALFEGLEPLGKLYVVVRNPGCVAEMTGAFGGFSRSGPFLNVATEGLHLHIRPDRITHAFALERTTAPDAEPMRSVEFYGGDGTAFLKAFLIQRIAKSAGEDFDRQVELFREFRASRAS